MNIITHKLSLKQYYKEQDKKNQIVLHHTVSGEGHEGDVNWWENTPERVATPYIVARNGDLIKTFDDCYWAHHLGIKKSFLLNKGLTGYENKLLNKSSIGIELDSWGGLEEKEDGFYTYTGKLIENVYVLDYKHRGYRGFEAYTPAQIKTTGELLKELSLKYDIDISYFGDIWDVTMRALRGENGLFTHVSYRDDKSDCYPDMKLIQEIQRVSGGR